MTQQKIAEAHQNVFGKEFRLFAAPGRVNLIGEHTDYNQGFVLPAAIDKRIYMAITPTTDEQVTINSADYKQTSGFSLSDETVDLPEWAYYPFGVVKELQKCGHRIGGFRATFGGDIPMGAGLSSSAALEIVFAFALNSLFDLQISKSDLARIAQLAEHNYAGVMCGIMDQFASVHGKAGHVLRLDCRSLEFSYFPLELGDYELILADTRVKHSLASSAYNQRRKECESGVKFLHSKMPDVQSLRDVLPETIRAYKKMMDETVFLRCEYVAEENIRVIDTCEALEAGNLKQVGTLMYQSHEGLRHKYDVSCNELDLLVDTAKTLDGVPGARMMGGGFGGCTINLVKSSMVDVFKSVIAEAYSKSFKSEPVFYQVMPSDGVYEI